jgi:hypothetical protein
MPANPTPKQHPPTQHHPTQHPPKQRHPAERPPKQRPLAPERPSPFPNRTNWSKKMVAAVAGLARAVGRRALAAATGELGRRTARAVALTVALTVVVVVLYDRGEVPSAAARPALAAPAGHPAAGTGSAGLRDPGDRGGLRGRVRPASAGERPAEVAAAWYAARSGVPRARVKPLQQDRLSARQVRVLVLADLGRGRLRTALVRLRLGSDGWSVR